MGTSSGGLWLQQPMRTGEMKKLKHFLKHVLFSAFTAAIFCSMVLCKQHTRYNYETKRLNYKVHDNIYDYNNNYKILRPKRDVSSGFKNMKSIHYCTWNDAAYCREKVDKHNH